MRKFLIAAFLIALTIGGIIAYQFYGYIYAANVPNKLENQILQIPTNSSFEEVMTLLQAQNMLKDEKSFRWLAEQMEYARPTMRSGQFKIEPGWSNIELIRQLRNGRQEASKVVLTNERLLEDVAQKAARFIEPDSASLINAFLNPDNLKELGYTPETLMTIFIPNTYELYWNTSPKEFLQRMKKEHDKFWAKEERLEKAKALNLSPSEVYTLASIVERETLQSSEKPRMAGVYLNRLKINMLLQADPTSVFATRDFNTTRVTNYHLQFDSPYNTYIYTGLPPGPISMSSISSIDGVLNREQHDYLYFCAVGDGTGFHNFAKTLAQHNQNAKKYRANLVKRGRR